MNENIKVRIMINGPLIFAIEEVFRNKNFEYLIIQRESLTIKYFSFYYICLKTNKKDAVFTRFKVKTDMNYDRLILPDRFYVCKCYLSDASDNSIEILDVVGEIENPESLDG